MRHLFSTMSAVPGSEGVNTALTHRFQVPPSCEVFTAALSKGQDTAVGFTGLSCTMAKHWPDSVKRRAYKALTLIWRDGNVPDGWKW